VAVAALVGAALGAWWFFAGLAVVLAAGAYLFSDRIALALTGARPAAPEGPANARLHNVVEGLCVAAGLPKPDLYLVDDRTINAFSVGRNPGHASLVVTSGLLDNLERVELEGVVAHELAHIRNHDTLLTTTAVGLPLLRLILPGRRESVADVTGVRFTRYPPGLIAALEKLRGEQGPGRSWATAHLWINAPNPPLEQRLAELRDL
jgi:heat shock protein HtpX